LNWSEVGDCELAQQSQRTATRVVVGGEGAKSPLRHNFFSHGDSPPFIHPYLPPFLKEGGGGFKSPFCPPLKKVEMKGEVKKGGMKGGFRRVGGGFFQSKKEYIELSCE